MVARLGEIALERGLDNRRDPLRRRAAQSPRAPLPGIARRRARRRRLPAVRRRTPPPCTTIPCAVRRRPPDCTDPEPTRAAAPPPAGRLRAHRHRSAHARADLRRPARRRPPPRCRSARSTRRAPLWSATWSPSGPNCSMWKPSASTRTSSNSAATPCSPCNCSPASARSTEWTSRWRWSTLVSSWWRNWPRQSSSRKSNRRAATTTS